MGFGGAPGRLLATSLSRAPSGIQTCGQLALSFNLLTSGFLAFSRFAFAICNQLALPCGLSQDCQFSLGLGGDPGCVLALSFSLAPGSLFAQRLGLEPCDQLALRLDFAVGSHFTLFYALAQRCQLALGLGGAADCRLAMSFSLAPSSIFV